MTKEDKKLLVNDLTGRLLYNVVVNVGDKDIVLDRDKQNIGLLYAKDLRKDIIEENHFDDSDFVICISGCYYGENIKPYLRPMSSMTSKEYMELSNLLPRYFTVCSDRLYCCDYINGGIINFDVLDTIIDFYNSHYLDWRGLIPKGLALEATKDMYKF